MKLPKVLQSFTTPMPPPPEPSVELERAVATLPGHADSWNNNSWSLPFYLYNGALMNTTSSGASIVTQEGLLGLPAAWSAVNLIAHACAVMLTDADVYDPMGNQVPSPTACKMPNELYPSPYDFWHEVVTTLLIYGNYVGIVYEGQVIPVHPSHVECRIGQDGMPEYRIGGNDYSMFDIVHVRGLTLPGTFWGHGVIEAQRLSLSGAVDMTNYAVTTYSTGGVPKAVLKANDRRITADQLQTLATDWATSFGHGQRKIVALPEGLSIETLAWKPQDMEFLASRQFSVAEIALMFGLNPGDLTANIGSGNGNITYANIGAANLERIKRSFAPWTMRVEQAWSRRLLPEGYTFVAEAESLLRLDPQTQAQLDLTRTQNDAAALAAGIVTLDEVRASRGLGPITPQLPTPQEITND